MCETHNWSQLLEISTFSQRSNPPFFEVSQMQKRAFAALLNVLEPTRPAGCTKMRAVACGSAANLRKRDL
jgi:hypothetical protein